jgi:hypothetical protein
LRDLAPVPQEKLGVDDSKVPRQGEGDDRPEPVLGDEGERPEPLLGPDGVPDATDARDRHGSDKASDGKKGGG